MSMILFPKVIERQPQPYVAMRRTVQMPFTSTVDATLPKLWAWVGQHRVEPAGPMFFKYNLIDMAADLEIDFGVPTETLLAADDEVVAGTLPGGRYASMTYRGHYEKLREVTAMLKAWIAANDYQLDMEPTPKGDRFASRLELYPNDPRELPDPDDWETVLAFKLRD